jgi:hypothetical protein
VNQFEIELVARLETLKYDARSACVFVYTELTLHYFFSRDDEIRERVNRCAGFWNNVFASLQASGFVALGRLYDSDARAHTIHALIKFIENNTGLFQPSALEKRKIDAGQSLECAQEFAAGSVRLAKNGLDSIRVEFETHRQFYLKHVQPIRHNVFAHASGITNTGRDALFSTLLVRDLEKIAVFPLRLDRALFGMYENGTELNLAVAPTAITDMLRVLPGSSTSTWEHLHAAKEVAEMVVWMMQAPLLDSGDQKPISESIKEMERKWLGVKTEDFGPDE